MKKLLLLFLIAFSQLFFQGCNVDEQQPVLIIASNEGESSGPNAVWQDFIEVDQSCLLTINSTASAAYSGSSINAGITLNIKFDGEIVASDFSFEGGAGPYTFHAAASTTFFLQPGRYNLEVERVDLGVNSDYKLKVNYYAVYAEE